jgi:hypothetical protein
LRISFESNEMICDEKVMIEGQHLMKEDQDPGILRGR